jgi:hypothetical protein
MKVERKVTMMTRSAQTITMVKMKPWMRKKKAMTHRYVLPDL